MSYYPGAHMSYDVVRELDNQLANVAEGSKEAYDLIRRITEVIQDFCDAVASKLPDSQIYWEKWRFNGESVVIHALEYRLDIERYKVFVTEFEEYLDTERGREYYQQNPRGVSASYDLCRDNATCGRYVTLVMK